MTDDRENDDTSAADPFRGLEPLGDVKIAPAVGIGAVALSLAMKYHDSTVVKDGAMYQQLKLEGVNIRRIDLDTVFDTAKRIEMHLLATSDRIASIVIDAIREIPEDEDDGAPTKGDST